MMAVDEATDDAELFMLDPWPSNGQHESTVLRCTCARQLYPERNCIRVPIPAGKYYSQQLPNIGDFPADSSIFCFSQKRAFVLL